MLHRRATPPERDPQTHAIIGAAMEAHRQLGCGFLELVYHAACKAEFHARDIPFQHEVDLNIHYKGQVLECHYRADFICYGEVLVELKAVEKLTRVDVAQLLNYLKATGLRRGLLLNFGGSSLEFDRYVYGP